MSFDLSRFAPGVAVLLSQYFGVCLFLVASIFFSLIIYFVNSFTKYHFFSLFYICRGFPPNLKKPMQKNFFNRLKMYYFYF